MDKALDKIINKLAEIKEWYTENKEAILKSEYEGEQFNYYFTDLKLHGRLLANLTDAVLDLINNPAPIRNGFIDYLLGDVGEEKIEEWFNAMRRKHTC